MIIRPLITGFVNTFVRTPQLFLDVDGNPGVFDQLSFTIRTSWMLAKACKRQRGAVSLVPTPLVFAVLYVVNFLLINCLVGNVTGHEWKIDATWRGT